MAKNRQNTLPTMGEDVIGTIFPNKEIAHEVNMDSTSKNTVLLAEYGLDTDKINQMFSDYNEVMTTHLFEDMESIIYQNPGISNMEVMDYLVNNGALDDLSFESEIVGFNFLQENRDTLDGHIDFLKNYNK